MKVGLRRVSMFRDLIRKNKELTTEECIHILKLVNYKLKCYNNNNLQKRGII